MPHYRLNLYNAAGQAEDPEGAEFADLAAAHRTAIRSIRSLLSAEALEGKINLHGHLDVVDDRGVVMARIPFSEAVQIVGP